MKILVTGANGYIGSKVVSRLLDMGYEVIATDLFDTHIDKRAKIVLVDIFADKDYYSIFDKPDVCLHMAWKDGFVHNSLSHILDLSSHFKFLSGLIRDGVKHIACMGSMHEIGYVEGAIDENTPTNPQTYYGVAKNALRKALEYVCKQNNTVYQWLRGYYIYGDDAFGNSIFCKIRKADSEGQKYFPFTSGKNKFDFISIEDLANQISCVVTQNAINGVINVCSGEPISLADKVEWYIKTNGLKIKLAYGQYPDRPFESPCIYGDNSKIQQILFRHSTKILVTGVNGQLGYDVCRELKDRGYTQVRGIDIVDLDITDEGAVHKYISDYMPDIVIHNAAWTAVDKAELMPDKVYAVNALGPKYIAESCQEINAKMMYISTDYVFDGKGDKFFETNDSKNGLSIYGKTKSQGEDFITNTLDDCWVIRISWAFGFNGNNFITTMLRLADSGKQELNVVCDQMGSPTYTFDLSKLMCDMIETEKYGIYHATNEGVCSWADFAKYIFKTANLDVKVNSVTTEEYKLLVPQQADRPLNSRLSKESLTNAGFNKLPTWQSAVERYIHNELKR